MGCAASSPVPSSSHPPAVAERAWPWIVDAGLLLYLAGTARSLSVRGGAFGKIFADLGADLPPATSLALSICKAPVLFAALAILTVCLALKNRLLNGPVAKLGISFLVLLGASAVVLFFNEAFFEPMLRLIQLVK